MKALITGISGQDAAYLSQLLLSSGYDVFGLDILPNYWRLEELGIEAQVEIIPADICDLSSLIRALQNSQAEEVYHLASQSFVGSSFDHPYAAGLTTGMGTLNVLEACRIVNPKIRFYNAATSELYGDSLKDVADENTPMHPNSPYAISKMYAYQITKLYREAYGMFACSGILFNHESPLRGLEFVTRKVTYATARIKLGLQHQLSLGNLNAKRDWGYAREYVDAMWLMLQQPIADDFVVATNEAHSIRELCEVSFSCLGLDWKNHVVVDESLLRPRDVNYLKGDYSKANRIFGWKPLVKFEELIQMMVEADIRRVEWLIKAR